MAHVNIVGGFPSFVGPVQQLTVFRVPEEDLDDGFGSRAHGDVQGSVAALVYGVHFRLLVQKQLDCFRIPGTHGTDQSGVSVLIKSVKISMRNSEKVRKNDKYEKFRKI